MMGSFGIPDVNRMTLEDFCRFYSDLDICCLCPGFLDENSSCHWKTAFYDGRWVAGTTAGGCMNNLDSFRANPQYGVKIDKLNSECSTKQGDKNLLVSLMQKPDKRNRRLVKNLHIGFYVFEVTEEFKAQRGKFLASFFGGNKPVAQTKSYINGREVMEFLMLKPGEYLIVPTTFNPNETASFILTIISKAETHVHENSGGQDYEDEDEEEPQQLENKEDDEKKRTWFRQNSNKSEEVDAELLLKLLNEQILKAQLSNLLKEEFLTVNTSITGKLNGEEFVCLWKKVTTYKDIFFRSDVSHTGTLLLSELRNAIMTSGKRMNDDILNLMAVRYGASGQITLESFISLVLRFDSMNRIFKKFSNGNNVTLLKSEWLYLSMYT